VLRFEVTRSVITVQREFRARFKKDIILVWCVLFKLRTKLKLHCNHRSGHLKNVARRKPSPAARHLGNWSRGPAVRMRSELLVEHRKRRLFLLMTVHVVSV
jgi:hypothetical protein